MKKIVISIVTWNSQESIHSCITSVLNQSFTDLELFIVDNNSSDDTKSIVESFKDSRLIFEKKSENTGFCGGHNYTIKNSSSEFVLLVNPDIILSQDYIEKALAVMKPDIRIGTVCGLLLQDDVANSDSLIDSAGLILTNSRVMKMRFHGKKRSEIILEKAEVFGADGALPLYRRSMIDDISYEGNFFDEMFFAHKEDWDVSWRSSIYGWKTIFSPECIAVHPRHFKPGNLKVRFGMSSTIKCHTVKNQLLLLLKNESALNFIKNAIYILPRQIFIFIYVILFERESLKAYKYVLMNYSKILRNRKVVQSRAR